MDWQNTFFKQKIPSPKLFKTYSQTQSPIESFSFHFHSQTSSGIRKKNCFVLLEARIPITVRNFTICSIFAVFGGLDMIHRTGSVLGSLSENHGLFGNTVSKTFMRCLIIPTGFGHPFILCDTSLQVHAKKQSKHILESYI